MRKKSREQIVEILRRVDRSLDEYHSIKEACENLGVSRSSFYRWQRKIRIEGSQEFSADSHRRKRIQHLEDRVTALGYAAQGKLVCPMQRRYIVKLLQKQQGWSQRRACRALKQSRSTQRYQKQLLPGLESVELLKKQFPIFGGEKISELASRKTGIKKNTLRKLYVRKKIATGSTQKVIYHPENVLRETPTRRYQSWGCDLTTSKLFQGRKIVWLAVIDEFTRECLLLEGKHSWSNYASAKRLKQLIDQHPSLVELRIDNAALWYSSPIAKMAQEQQIELAASNKGSPWENAKIESFFASFHREFLGRYSFANLKQANAAAIQYRELYNQTRPHSAHEGKAPYEFIDELAQRDKEKTDDHGMDKN